MLIDSGDSRPMYTATPGRVANLKIYRRVAASSRSTPIPTSGTFLCDCRKIDRTIHRTSTRGHTFCCGCRIKGTRMKISAVCHKCGDIADANYSAQWHRIDATDIHGTEPRRVVTV